MIGDLPASARPSLKFKVEYSTRTTTSPSPRSSSVRSSKRTSWPASVLCARIARKVSLTVIPSLGRRLGLGRRKPEALAAPAPHRQVDGEQAPGPLHPHRIARHVHHRLIVAKAVLDGVGE